MAGKALGSTVSLQGIGGGGETIPKEYHRKVMKKIAQLTKVIYTLNTKNDEHEAFVQKLKSLHETEMQRLLVDSASRLKKIQDGSVLERDATEKREQLLKTRAEEVEEQRRQLQETQVSYERDVKESFRSLKEKHAEQVAQLGQELERIRKEQSSQVKEVAELRDGVTRRINRQLAALRSQYEKEVSTLDENRRKETQRLESEVDKLKKAHANDVSQLNKQCQAEVTTLKQELSKAQNELLSLEGKKWEEREESLRRDLAEREESLKQQMSTLSTELRAARDKLALSEQRLKELEAHCEDSKMDSGRARGRLAEAEREVEELTKEVGSLRNELEISREQYRQQSAEMQSMSGSTPNFLSRLQTTSLSEAETEMNLARLEAVRVSNEGELKELKSHVSLLQEKVGCLEKEREALQSSQSTASDQQVKRIKALEQEIALLSKEKVELRAQYAREIEAAHGKLGERESALGSEHIKALQETQYQYQMALEELQTEHASAMDKLRDEIESAAQENATSLQTRHSTETASLQRQLSAKTSELNVVLGTLDRLRDSVAEREKGLGSASETIEKLRKLQKEREEEVKELRVRLDALVNENQQLKLSLEGLGSQHSQALHEHRLEVQSVRDKLTKQLEQMWMQRIKEECASVRAELLQRHEENSKAALTELASLKDTIFKKTKDKWEEEKKRLSEKIKELEGQIHEIQQAATESLKKTKNSSEEQVMALRKQLEEAKREHVRVVDELDATHRKQLHKQQMDFEGARKLLKEELVTQHRAELQGVQQANGVAVVALRDKLLRDKKEELQEMTEMKKREMDALRTELQSLHEVELAQVRADYQTALERLRLKTEEITAQKQREVSSYESKMAGLQGEMERRSLELGKLRDQVNGLMVQLNSARKELEIRAQEIATVKREASNRIRLREQQLSSAHQSELESLSSQHKHQSQMLLSDFNRAKEMLNTKIAELQKQLLELERQYHSRESRPEDLEAIQELKTIVREQERRMKDLIAEKRVYQLELMNREKNYNQIFNAHPQIGVLDPLQQKKKKKSSDMGSQRHASAPSLISPGATDFSRPSVTVVDDGSGVWKSKDMEPVQRAQHLKHASSSGDIRPRRLVALHDSPLTQHRTLSKPSRNSSAPLQPSPPAVSPTKQSMVVR